MPFSIYLPNSATRRRWVLGAFLINERFFSVAVLEPLLRHASISQEIIPALDSFEAPNGLMIFCVPALFRFRVLI